MVLLYGCYFLKQSEEQLILYKWGKWGQQEIYRYMYMKIIGNILFPLRIWLIHLTLYSQIYERILLQYIRLLYHISICIYAPKYLHIFYIAEHNKLGNNR